MRLLRRMMVFKWLNVCVFVFGIFFSYSYAMDNVGNPDLPAEYKKIRNTAMQQGYDLTNALPKNFRRDGSVDYRDQIQNALNKRKVVIFPDFPVLINDKGLTVSSNTILVFQPNSKIILKSSNKPKYEVLRLHNISNVYLFDAKVEGDKYRHNGRTGEFGNGISLRNAKDVHIINATVEKCWGDGIIVGSFNNKECANIELFNILLNDNRRNGISITCVNDLKISNLIAKNTSGTLPMSGICIEPNNNDEMINNILIKNSVTENNERCGIQIGLGKLPGSKRHDTNIVIESYIDRNSGIGIYLGSFRDQYYRSSKLGGNIIIRNARLVKNKESLKTGFNFRHGPDVLISDLSIETPDESQSLENIVKRLKSTQYSTYVQIK